MWLHFTWEPEEQNNGKKTANDSQTRIISSHQDAHLHPGMVVLLLRLHKKAWNKKKKKDIHLVQSRRRLVRVRACICLHLCMSYLCVHLRHWAAGYAALKGCVSAAIPLSLSLSRSVSLAHTWTPLPVLSAVCIVHHHRSVHLYSIINALS